jgi:hypothetical protein
MCSTALAAASSGITSASRIVMLSAATIWPPLKPAWGVVMPRGSRYISIPRGDRLLARHSVIPASRNSCAALIVSGCSVLSCRTSVPSTSVTTRRMGVVPV